jgi:hypothetical protein
MGPAASLKVIGAELWPVLKVPVSKTPPAGGWPFGPASLVAVCGMLSWFVQVTVSPWFTGTGSGLYVMSLMLTDMFLAIFHSQAPRRLFLLFVGLRRLWGGSVSGPNHSR